MRPDVIAFWDSRAELGESAGTNDVMLKRLEIAELLRRVPECSSILDVGCGNGVTLNTLADQRECSGVGIDISPHMIASAVASASYGAEFHVANIAEPESLTRVIQDEQFDIAISERCLINLESPDEQWNAFNTIMLRLHSGGKYFMMENSADGLERLNAFRASVGLVAMKPPWHNLYLHEPIVRAWGTKQFVLESEVSLTSTYYFVSRVLYARQCADQGIEPEYESSMNQLALQLPIIGDLGATRLWVWRRV